MTIGLRRCHDIGECIPVIVVDGRMIAQPCVVLAESTYEAWVDSVRMVCQRDPHDWEVAQAQEPDVRFYRVSTD